MASPAACASLLRTRKHCRAASTLNRTWVPSAAQADQPCLRLHLVLVRKKMHLLARKAICPASLVLKVTMLLRCQEKKVPLRAARNLYPARTNPGLPLLADALHALNANPHLFDL